MAVWSKSSQLACRLGYKRPVVVLTVAKRLKLALSDTHIPQARSKGSELDYIPFWVSCNTTSFISSLSLSQKHLNTLNTREHRLKVRACSKDQVSKTRPNAEFSFLSFPYASFIVLIWLPWIHLYHSLKGTISEMCHGTWDGRSSRQGVKQMLEIVRGVSTRVT